MINENELRFIPESSWYVPSLDSYSIRFIDHENRSLQINKIKAIEPWIQPTLVIDNKTILGTVYWQIDRNEVVQSILYFEKRYSRLFFQIRFSPKDADLSCVRSWVEPIESLHYLEVLKEERDKYGLSWDEESNIIARKGQ